MLIFSSENVHDKSYYVCPLFFCSLPTVFITECVLIYMEPEHSAAIINWAGTNFKNAVFINYEQVSVV